MAKDDIQVIKEYVKKQKKAFTIGDVSTVTGLPVLESEEAIKTLMADFDCRLKVTDQGDLLYDFGNNLYRRGRITFKQYFNQFLGILWKGFTWLYKVWIALTLVIYFVIFVLLLIAMIVAASSQNDGKGTKNRGGGLVTSIIRIFAAIFDWRTFRRTTYTTYDPWGYPYDHYDPKKPIIPPRKPRTDKKKDKSFIAAVYDFVFGPGRVHLNPHANRMEVASFLRASKGMITTSEIQSLAGWTREEAESFMTECLTVFDGDADISSNGTLFGSFKDLIRGEKQKSKVPVVLFWDEYEPEYEFTGNTKTHNFWIVFMNAFNLIFSGIVVSGAFETSDFDFLLFVALGIVPLIFSITFFLIPFVRSFYVKRMQREQHKQNIRKRLMKVIYKRHKEEIGLQELTLVANQWAKTEEKLSRKVVNEVMQECIIDLGGEGSVNENGDIIYSFERLDMELDDIQRLRMERGLDADLGDIVFDSSQ